MAMPPRKTDKPSRTSPRRVSVSEPLMASPPHVKTHATSFLSDAADTMKQRATDRDQVEERSMAKIVKVFNELNGTNLTEAQGWNFMVILKMVRARTGDTFRADDYVDGLAYSALEAESRS